MNEKLLNISMIGVSGSGKTMLLSGLYKAFIESCIEGNNGAVISVTGSEDDPFFREEGTYNELTFAQQLERLKTTKLMAVQGKDGKLGRASAGTVEMSHLHLNWDVASAVEGLRSLTIKFTDYRGGILSLSSDNITNVDTEECKAFMDNLYESEIILILVDGIKLAQYRDNASLRKEKTGADRINVLMNSVMRCPRKGVTLMLVVTKVDSDKIPDDLKADNYRGLCQLACETVECVYKKSKIMTQNHEWTFAGENNSITQYVPEMDEYICAIKNSADVKQHNIDSVMLYSIRNALTHRCKDIDKEIELCEKSIGEQFSKSTIFAGPTKRAFINELVKDKEGYIGLRNAYSSMLATMNEGFSQYFGAVRRFGVN